MLACRTQSLQMSLKFGNKSKEKRTMKKRQASQRTVAGKRSEVLLRLATAFVLPRERAEIQMNKRTTFELPKQRIKQQHDFARIIKSNVRRVRSLRAAKQKKVKNRVVTRQECCAAAPSHAAVIRCRAHQLSTRTTQSFAAALTSEITQAV